MKIPMLFAVCLTIRYLLGLQWVISCTLRYSQAVTCDLFETELTCHGTGDLTQEIIRSVGVYTRYETVIIKSGITHICQNCFENCVALKNITVPDTVIHFGQACFGGTALTEFYVPKSVCTMDRYPWNTARHLYNIVVDSANPQYSSYNGSIYTKDYSKILHIPSGAYGVTFHSSCRIIQEHAMRWNQNIVDFQIGSKITSVGRECFYSSNFKSISIPKSVKTFDATAFSGCKQLRSVSLDADSTDLCWDDRTEVLYQQTLDGDIWKKTAILWIAPTRTWITLNGALPATGGFGFQTLPNAESLIEVKTNNGNYQIGDHVNNKAQVVMGTRSNELRLLTCVGGAVTVTIPDSVKAIEQQAFRGCRFLKTVTLGTGVTKIWGSAFRDCPNLTTVNFNNGSPTINSMAFSEVGNVEFINWGNVKAIAEKMFELSYIETLDIKHIETIGSQACYSCSVLREVIFGSVKTIGNGAFSECPLLYKLDMSACTQLKTIGSATFASCPMLTEIVLPSTVEDLQSSSFSYNPNLTSITFHGESAHYVSVNGSVYSRDLETFVICASGLVYVEVLPETKSIGYNAFYGCMNLVDVILRDNITSIASGAFFDCMSIESIRLPKSVEIVGHRMVACCSKLKKVLYCNSVETARVTNANEDPFPTDPEIWVVYNYTSDDDMFLDHSVVKILDQNCNIPTTEFTEIRRLTYSIPPVMFVLLMIY